MPGDSIYDAHGDRTDGAEQNRSPPPGKVNGVQETASIRFEGGTVRSGTDDTLSMSSSHAGKASSSLMPQFMVSAPGKVIVYGEHAVVHGKAAIAAAISLRSYLLVTTLSKSQRTIALAFPDVSLDHTWEIDELPWATFSETGKRKAYHDRVTSLDPNLLKSLAPHIATVSTEAPEDVRSVHQAAARCFLYLFLSLGSPESSTCIYTLRSTIPIGAGLGSSASISVCISTALLFQARALCGPHPDQSSGESEMEIERINQWAFVGELCIHGNPSGVDNTVASGGKAVLFKRTEHGKPPTVVPLRSFPELPLLLINTKQPRSTATEVAKVGALKKKHPEITDTVLDAIDKITESAHGLISSDAFDPQDPACIERLGELFSVNHGLLVALGVSHPKLEHVRALIDHAGIGWTKLTGAGGGGCAISLLKPGTDAEAVQRLQQELGDAGFERYETTLAGDGVGVLWPAFPLNHSGEEEGHETDQERFLNAVGNERIESLVGVGALEQQEHWKFWRP